MRSLVGIAVLLSLALLLSNNRRAIRWRTVLGALGLQIGLGGLVLYADWGKAALRAISSVVANIIDYSGDGIRFLFGGLVSDKMFEVLGGGGFIFALRVLPIIVFFSSLIAVLYHLKIMQFVIAILGGAVQKLLGTSRAESLSATANIFVGQTEAPLVVRPYIAHMTQSELFAVMSGGLASVAGSVLAGYAQMGVDLEYLIAASFMAAPGGLLFAKIIKPETETPRDQVDGFEGDLEEEGPVNVIDAAAMGASSGLHLALNVGAMLLAFIGLLALLNGMVGWLGGFFGYGALTMQEILGYVFAPLAFVIGIPWDEAVKGGAFIGEKLILNEFVAYADFVQVKETLSLHTQAIISFALCGFANLSSIAILLGGLGGIAPSRRADIARFGLLAVAAGSLSNLMSAAIAGFFLSLT